MNTNLRWLFGAIVLPIIGHQFTSAYAKSDAPPPIAFVQASNVPCKVGRPNVKSTEIVTWNGQCADGLAAGRGTAQWFVSGKPTLRFEGTFVRGLLEGKGKMAGADGDSYEGDYKGGLRHGHGVYLSSAGERFEGEYLNNRRAAAASSSPPANPQVAPAPTTPPAPATQQATPNTSASRANSGDFAMLRCDHGFLATVAVAAKVPMGLPNEEDAFMFRGSGEALGTLGAPGTLGANQATAETVSKSNAVRLAKEAVVFAQANRAAANCQFSGLPPIVSDIVLIFKDKVPEKVPAVGKNTAAAIPGLLVYAEYGVGDTWHLYNISYQREKIDAAKKKEEGQEAVIAQFTKKHDVLPNKDVKGLYANPFAFEGNKLMLVVGFEQMQSATTGLFYLPKEGILVVNDIPKSAFLGKGKVILAAKVLGNVKFDGVVGQIVKVNGMVPNLKFLGALICRDNRCDQMDER